MIFCLNLHVMKTKLIALIVSIGISTFFLSCSEGQEDVGMSSGMVSLSFTASPFEQYSFTGTRSSEISDVCGKLLLAVYREGKLDTIVSQDSTDKDFGLLSVRLTPGVYSAMILAHSSAKDPDVSNPVAVNFRQDNLSDVLYWYGDISLHRDSTVEAGLHRAVAKVRITSQDSLRNDVSRVRLWYSGGSFIFNALEGTAARPTDDATNIEMSEHEKGKPLDVSCFTFPTDSGKLSKLRITISYEKGGDADFITVSDVPVKANTITHLQGRLSAR